MKQIFLILMLGAFQWAIGQSSIHQFGFETIDGEQITFEQFKGKKILVVNTASECGFTPQYEALQQLHEKYGDQLVVIGFPANNFGGQEPGSNEEISGFCQKNYGVTFLMAAKSSVKGDDINPVFKWLCEQENENFQGPVKWNFEKFILDENGQLITRFRSMVKPDSEKILSAIEK